MEKRIVVEKRDLLPVLDRAVTIVPSSGVPYLQNFCVDVKEDYLTVTSTNASCSYSIRCEAKSSSKFKFYAPAKKFQSVIRKTILGELELYLVDRELKVLSGTAEWTIQLSPVRDFPSLDVDSVITALVSKSSFLASLDNVKSSLCRDEARPYLRMVRIRDSKMVACDGIRFQQSAFSCDLDIHIPVSVLTSITGLCSFSDEDYLNVRTSDTLTEFSSGSISFVYTNSGHRFPNVESVMLRTVMENKSSFTVDRMELIRSIDRVKTVSDPETQAVGMMLTTGSVIMFSKDKMMNTATDNVPTDWKGKNRVLVFNHTTLIELLKSYDFEHCTLFLGEDTKSRKSLLALKNEEKGVVGIIPQIGVNMSL